MNIHCGKRLFGHDLKNHEKPMFFLKLDGAGRLFERLERSFINTHEEEHKTYGVISVADHYEQIYQRMCELFKTEKKDSSFAIGIQLQQQSLMPHSTMTYGSRRCRNSQFDWHKICKYFPPKNFNMYLDMYQVGLSAMDMLVKLLDGEYYQPRIKNRKYIY